MKISRTALFIGLASLLKKGFTPFRDKSLNMAKMKMSILYLKSIRTFRLMFLSLLGVGLGMVFLLAGVILFYATIFLYAPWSAEVKLYTGLAGTVVCFSLAGVVFYKLASSEKWLDIFNAQNIVAQLTEETPEETKSPEAAARNN